MLVQPTGRPIIASTNSGLSRSRESPFATVSLSGRAFRAIVSGDAPEFRQSRADGVGRSLVVTSVRVGDGFVGLEPDRRLSIAVGVGRSRTSSRSRFGAPPEVVLRGLGFVAGAFTSEHVGVGSSAVRSDGLPRAYIFTLFASLAVGVGRHAPKSVGLPRMKAELCRAASLAVGVGRSPCRAAVWSVGVPALGRDAFAPFCWLPAYGDAVGVGSKQEDPVAEVRGADGARWNTVPLRSPPARGQRGEDGVQSARGKESWNVFEEEEASAHLASDPPDVGPEPAFVVGAAAGAGHGVGLAGEACRDEIHASSPASGGEGREVAPDRSAIQGRFFHPGHEDGRSETLPLDSAHKLVVGARELDAELEPADAGAECQGA